MRLRINAGFNLSSDVEMNSRCGSYFHSVENTFLNWCYYYYYKYEVTAQQSASNVQSVMTPELQVQSETAVHSTL